LARRNRLAQFGAKEIAELAAINEAIEEGDADKALQILVSLGENEN